MSQKTELSTLKSKLNIFKYLAQTDKKWSIEVIILILAYIIIGISLSFGAIIDRFRYGSLSSTSFNMMSNSIFMIVLLVIVLGIILILTYKRVGRSLTTSNITIEFIDDAGKFIIEYKDMLGKFRVDGNGDKVITNTIFYRDITNIGVIHKYNILNIQGFIRIIKTDTASTNELVSASSNQRSSTDNITLFLTKDELNLIISRISYYYNIQYIDTKIWYQKEVKSEN